MLKSASNVMRTADLLRLLGWFTGISVLQQVKSLRIPTTVFAVEGSCVVVDCQTDHHDQVVWYQYDQSNSPIVYDRYHPEKVEQQFKGRTSVLGNAAEGNCTLKIDDVRKTDNNLKIYVCINPDSCGKYREQAVTIRVERNTPAIFFKKKIVEGEIFQAKCNIFYSCIFSPPTLIWITNPSMEASNITGLTGKAKGQWFSEETLYGLATNKIHELEISCSAQFTIFTTESVKATLNILYAPVILPESYCHLNEGVLQCLCKAKASPNASVHWTINGNDSVPSSFSLVTTKEQDITSVVMSGPVHGPLNISCTATNMQGRKTKWLPVDSDSSLSLLFTLLLLPGLVLLLGLVVLIYRMYPRNRPEPLPSNCRQKEIFSNVAEREVNCESDNLSEIYVNGIMEDMLAPSHDYECDNPGAIYKNWRND